MQASPLKAAEAQALLSGGAMISPNRLRASPQVRCRLALMGKGAFTCHLPLLPCPAATI